MEKYHINEATKRPNLCKSANCSLAKHYPTRAAAQASLSAKVIQSKSPSIKASGKAVKKATAPARATVKVSAKAVEVKEKPATGKPKDNSPAPFLKAPATEAKGSHTPKLAATSTSEKKSVKSEPTPAKVQVRVQVNTSRKSQAVAIPILLTPKEVRKLLSKARDSKPVRKLRKHLKKF